MYIVLDNKHGSETGSKREKILQRIFELECERNPSIWKNQFTRKRIMFLFLTLSSTGNTSLVKFSEKKNFQFLLFGAGT